MDTKQTLQQAWQLYEHENFIEALNHFKLLLLTPLVDDDQEACLRGAGWCYFGLEEYSLAYNHFERACQLVDVGVNTLEAQLGLGLSANHLGMHDFAETLLDKVAPHFKGSAWEEVILCIRPGA